MSLLEKLRARGFWDRENRERKSLGKRIARAYLSILAVGFLGFIFVGTVYEVFLAGGWKGIAVIFGTIFFMISLLWAVVKVTDDEQY